MLENGDPFEQFIWEQSEYCMKWEIKVNKIFSQHVPHL